MEDINASSQNDDQPLDRLIQLVEDGDPDTILSEENLSPSFNELIKYGLVTLKDEKILITPKGLQAKEEGVQNFINHLKEQEKQLEVQNKPKKEAVTKPFNANNKKLWQLSLFLLLAIAMIISLFNIFQ